jgi:hypothetical protein
MTGVLLQGSVACDALGAGKAAQVGTVVRTNEQKLAKNCSLT